jgi:ribonuclease Z
VQATVLSHRVRSFAYSFTEKDVETKLNAEKLNSDGIMSGPLWGRLQRGESVTLPDGRVVDARAYILPPRKPRKIIVGGDNDTPALLGREARNADVLIHEATYTEAMLNKVGPAPQHSSAKRVAQFADEAKIPNLVLTHFSARYQDQEDGEPSLADIEAEARAYYSGRLFLAHDFARYFLGKDGVLNRTE